MTTSRLVDVDWLREHLTDASVRVVDATVHLTFDADGAHVASGREDYLKAHIPGAVFADQIADLTDHAAEAPFAAASSEQFAAAVGALGIDNATTVVFYDGVNGIWATRLWWQFGLEGHRDVRVLDGGFAAWTAAGAPVEAGEVVTDAATFAADRQDERVTDTGAVEAVVAAGVDAEVVLVNALDADSFAAGHIPGSVNVPFASLVNADGTLRSAEELREAFAAEGVLDDPRPVVAYCGGGIAATAVTFALQSVGRDDVAVYDGSMNAWTADPQRPLERA